jgi:hypothetical protein
MLDQPSVIKRPVIDWGEHTTVGFDPAVLKPLGLRAIVGKPGEATAG